MTGQTGYQTVWVPSRNTDGIRTPKFTDKPDISMRYRDFADKTFANRTFANTPPGISPIGESTIGESLIGEIPISHIYTSQRRCSNVISVSVYTDAEIVDAPGTLCQCRR
jgi:hypothetical protein